MVEVKICHDIDWGEGDLIITLEIEDLKALISCGSLIPQKGITLNLSGEIPEQDLFKHGKRGHAAYVPVEIAQEFSSVYIIPCNPRPPKI